MDYNLNSILPGEISDETAYHLANFINELGLLLDSKYFCQIRNYYQSEKFKSQHSDEEPWK